MENNTVHYLTSIINLLQKKPEIQNIIDTHGLGQELTFGQIGFKTSEAFLRVYEILNNTDEAETTPIHETESNQTKQYSFHLAAPVNLWFFHCTGVFDEQNQS